MIASVFKKTVRNVFRAFGYNVVKREVIECSPADIARSLNLHEIDLVFDVGANSGIYAASLFAGGYKGRIVSFEPLTQAYRQLSTRSESNPLWQVAERCALGDQDGEVEINISANSESSSILPMLKTCEQAAPTARYFAKEETMIRRLDSVADKYLEDAKAPFLKLDVQGFEDRVLQGAQETLPRIKGIQIELSLVPLYEKQKLWRELVDEITARGFELYSLLPGFTDPKTDRLLQMDGIFFRDLTTREG